MFDVPATSTPIYHDPMAPAYDVPQERFPVYPGTGSGAPYRVGTYATQVYRPETAANAPMPVQAYRTPVYQTQGQMRPRAPQMVPGLNPVAGVGGLARDAVGYGLLLPLFLPIPTILIGALIGSFVAKNRWKGAAIGAVGAGAAVSVAWYATKDESL